MKERCQLIEGKTQEEEIEICLNCPYTRCLLEVETKLKIQRQRPRTIERNEKARQFANQGATVIQIAHFLGFSERTIRRALNK
jgi:hypothetical protein